MPEKATEVGTGLGAFLTQLFVAKKLIPPGTVLPDHVAWEIVNQATGGTPGQGAMTRGALGATGSIPTTRLAGKVGKTAAESGLFAGITAISGGDVEDIIVSALVPIAFNGWNFARQRSHLTRYEKQLRQQALKAHEQRVKTGMSQSVSYLHYNADMRTIDNAVAKAKQKIYRDDAFAPAREKWEAERQKALKLIAKGGKENKARGNAILEFIERGPGGPLREQPREFPAAKARRGALTPADEFRMQQVAGQIERGRQRSAIAEQRQRYDSAMRRAISKDVPAPEPVQPIPQPAPQVPAGTPIEQARRRAAEALEAKKAEVAAGPAEASLLAQKYSRMEDILDALETEGNQNRRNVLLDEAERIDREITKLSNLQEKNLPQLHAIAKRAGVKVPKGATATAIRKLLTGAADLSRIQKTPTGYRVDVPLPGARGPGAVTPHDFDGFAEAAYFLEQEKPPQVPAEAKEPDSFMGKLEKDLATIKEMEKTPSTFDWGKTKVGDVTPFGDKIIARRIKRKNQAKKLADQQGGRVIIDGKRTWAVVRPTEAHAEPAPPEAKAPAEAGVGAVEAPRVFELAKGQDIMEEGEGEEMDGDAVRFTITPSAKQAGQVQATAWDEEGRPIGDLNFDTVEEAEAAIAGEVIPEGGAIDIDGNRVGGVRWVTPGRYIETAPAKAPAPEAKPGAKGDLGIGALPGMAQDVREIARNEIRAVLSARGGGIDPAYIGDRAINYWESIQARYTEADRQSEDESLQPHEREAADNEAAALAEELWEKLEHEPVDLEAETAPAPVPAKPPIAKVEPFDLRSKAPKTEGVISAVEQKRAFLINGVKFRKKLFQGGWNAVALPKGMSAADVQVRFGFNMGQEAVPEGEKKSVAQAPRKGVESKEEVKHEPEAEQQPGVRVGIRKTRGEGVEEAPPEVVEGPEAPRAAPRVPDPEGGGPTGGRLPGESTTTGDRLSSSEGDSTPNLDTTARRGRRTRSPTNSAGIDYRITEADQIGKGGPKAKYHKNLTAIKLLKQIEEEGRKATPEEQAVLVQYVGWGGMPRAKRKPDG
jgi:hypothetical protein